MLQPPIFRETRPEVMHELMRAHPLAALIASATGRLSADHVPLVLNTEAETPRLEGHIAIANPLFRKTKGEIEVMAIFQGPQTYITPSWYASKQEHGKVVPTWNYAVVHARGALRFIRDEDWLIAHLNDLTNQQESTRETPWQVSDAPGDFLRGQLKAMVGFEIVIEELQGTWKMSQNKNEADKAGVISGLQNDSAPEAHKVSELVERRG